VRPASTSLSRRTAPPPAGFTVTRRLHAVTRTTVTPNGLVDRRVPMPPALLEGPFGIPGGRPMRGPVVPMRENADGWGYDDEWAGREERRKARAARKRKRRRRKAAKRRGWKAACKPGGNLEARMQARLRRQKGSAAAASAMYSTAATISTMALPWSAVAGGIIAGVAVGLNIGNALRKKGNLALQGDEAAIKGFMRRSAKWSKAKRKRRATKLLRRLKKVEAKIRRQCKRRKRGPTNRALVRKAKLQLKLIALTALEIGAKKHPKQPAVRNEPDTSPEVTETDPAANVDRPDDLADTPEFSFLSMESKVGGIPAPMLLAGGVVGFGLLAVLVLSGGRRQNPRARRRARPRRRSRRRSPHRRRRAA